MSEKRVVSVLVVEDHPGDLELVRERLRDLPDHEMTISTVSTLREAMWVLASSPVDVVLLDLNLPDSNGIETLRRLRDAHEEVATIVFSGQSSEDLRHRVYLEGAQDFIGKNEPASRLLSRSILYALERHRAQSHQRQMHKLISMAPDAVLVVDVDGTVLFVNQAALDLFGRKREDFVGDLVGFSVMEGQVSEIEILCGEKKKAAEMHVVHLEWEGRDAYLASIRDITKQKKLDEQLRQAQKVEAIGRLAGGVAHDFNNLMTVIVGYSEIALRQLANNQVNNEMLHEMFHEVFTAGQRASRLTSQLLAFSRKSIYSLKPVDLNQIISELEKMLRRLIPEDIELICTLYPDLELIVADPSQIEQIIMNLVVNARDAMPRGGRLVIKTDRAVIDKPPEQVSGELQAGAYAVMEITDTGTGMNEETLSHIFEPFFTTKEVGKGTGLGLATVYGSVKQLNGHVTVDSKVDRGATFKIYLPLTEKSTADKPDASQYMIPQGKETVLLIEDEKSVREYTRYVLDSAGYQVLEAKSGEDALSFVQDRKGQIDLLLADVVMPETSGRELAETVQKLDARIKVLYMSGHTDDAIVRYGVLQDDMPFVQKPFSPEILARKIREVLDSDL